MTKLVILVLIYSLAASALDEVADDKYIPPQPRSSTQPPPPPPTTTTSTTTTSTTPSPITTKSTTTSTTSTTASPKTTTTSSPTPTPTPTPTPPPSPKPTPAPEPPKPVDPTVGVWQLNYTNSNVSCVLLEFALQINVPYQTKHNKTFTAPVDVPQNATISGECSKDNTQTVELKWLNENNQTDLISMSFIKNATSKIYTLVDVQVSLTPDNKSFIDIVNDTTPLNLRHKHEEFRTTLAHSYKCAKKQELNLTDDNSNKTRGSITVSSLQFQVFQNSTNKQFTDVEDCASGDTPDVVPIAVGCALAALVIIVLIAYLIGRRRGQARGYLSM